MKRVLLLALSLVVLVSVVAKAQDVVEIIFWSPFDYVGPGQRTLNELVDMFNAQHEHIRVIHQGQGEIQEKLKMAVIGGIQVDVAWNFPKEIIDENIAIPMERLVEESGYDISKFWPRVWGEIGTYRGVQWGFPFEIGSEALIYNKDAFDSIGAAGPPAYWSEYLTYAKKLTDPDKNVYGIQLEAAFDSWKVVQMIWRNGGDVFSEDGLSVTFTDERTIEAVQWYGDLQAVHQVCGGWFTNGDAMMHIEHAGWHQYLKDSCSFEFGTAPPPIADVHGQRASHSYYKDLTILRSVPEREQAAWTFVQWLMAPEQQAIWCANTGYLPVTRDVLDTDLYQRFLAENPRVYPWIEELNYLNDPDSYRGVAFWEVLSYLQTAIDQVRLGQKNAYTALTELQGPAQVALEEVRARVFGK